MLPYGRHSITEEDIEAVVSVLRSDWLTTGPAVTRFEEALSALSGGHPVVSCSSGTAALHMAYSCLDLRPGDEVITTPLTFVATAGCASMVGASVRFADVDPATALLDPGAVQEVITERTRAVTAVDFAGVPCDYEALAKVAEQTGAIVIADAAHSIGASHEERPVGDLADLTTYSFFPTKNLTTAEGGAVVARDPAHVQRLREFRNNGLVRDPERFQLTGEGPWHQEVHRLGVNYRLSDLACALGLTQLRRIEEFKQRRAAVFDRYVMGLQHLDGLALPSVDTGSDPAWHLFSVRILDGRRREVYTRMRAAGIGVQVNYIPVYWHPVYQNLGYRRGLCPSAEQFYQEQLSLPMFADLPLNEVDRVVALLEGILR